LIDLIGVDVHIHASEALHAALGEERMAPPLRLLQMRDEGHLGRKSGQGFYDYQQP
jgi:3-hydroxyacyl-CoA dehydrogenase